MNTPAKYITGKPEVGTLVTWKAGDVGKARSAERPSASGLQTREQTQLGTILIIYNKNCFRLMDFRLMGSGRGIKRIIPVVAFF